MTYCVGMLMDRGLVLMSDTRTNSGVDNISVFKKMHCWSVPGERIIGIMTAGNLATTQRVVSLLEERQKAKPDRHPTLLEAPTMFDVAQQVGILLRDTIELRPDGGTSRVNFGATIIVAGHRLEKAVSSADVPQTLVAGYTYDLPFGYDKRLKTGSKLVDKYLLGGWVTSGIVTLQNGTPLGISTELGLPGIGGVRPNVVSGQFFSHQDRSTFDPGKDTYLNINAFAAPAPFTFGNAPRLFSQIRAFGTRQWDAVLQKSVPIHESLRFAIKAEFFNVLNIVNWGAPVTDINNPSFGRIFGAGPARTGQVSATLFW